MHGINELNFALYDAAGYDFQPRYTNLYDASQNIVSSERFSSRPDHLILPTTEIDEKLITDQEDSFKRIMVSVLSKTCAVSTIIKKLTSSPKSHQTRKAIAEYNKILRSIHILKSINHLDYRQNIQKALNRTELYHFLTGEVRVCNPWENYRKNRNRPNYFPRVYPAGLQYNSVTLSRIYTNFLKNGDHAQITALKNISPCSWINFNLYGLFELKNYFNATIPEIKTGDFKESLLKNDYKGFA
ncbi:MAG: hypothetical protein ACJA2S_001585 [Cyclobacteriaceae bacterium]|jgi:hypothetical protein